MALQPWPGFDFGGALWFINLTLPALELGAWTGYSALDSSTFAGLDPGTLAAAFPLGTAGVLLPVSGVVCMLMNIDQAFGRVGKSHNGMPWASLLWHGAGSQMGVLCLRSQLGVSSNHVVAAVDARQHHLIPRSILWGQLGYKRMP